jgi:N-dimethylarginine dimethylaminohydrolase
MGKPQRRGEPSAQRAAFESWDIAIAGVIEPPGQLEGGDVVWLDDARWWSVADTGPTTRASGSIGELLGRAVELHVVPLPHWRGPGDVFHLMSVISPSIAISPSCTPR